MKTKLDLTKPVQTREGKPVRIICTDRKDPWGFKGHPIVGLIDHGDREEVASWTEDGKYSPVIGCQASDLINVPEKVVRYVNFYVNARSYMYSSRAEADEYASAARIACVRIEYTVGQFDD